MPNSANVTVGKPKVAGAVFYAPTSTQNMPTDSTTALHADFTANECGYISEEGVTNGNDIETTDIKAWGGDTVDSEETGFADTFSFTMIEATNITVLKAVYNDNKVTGTFATGIKVSVGAIAHQERAWVIDQILRNSATKRIVIPKAKVIALEEITYTDGEAVGYNITLGAYPDSTGHTHYEYIKEATP